MNKADKAAVFCQEVLAELEKTTDIEERIILLSVLTNQMNEWTLEMKLDAIRRKSRELTDTNS